MSKKIYLFSLVLLAVAFTACSETETVDKYDNWRSRNESFIDSLANVFEAGTDSHGEAIRMNWSLVPGAIGTCHVGTRKWMGNDGKEHEGN